MKFKTPVLFVLLLVLSTSCKKEDTVTGSDSFTNSLTLGTGMNASNLSLVGAGNTFTRMGGSVNVFYRLESAADLGGAGLSIKIEKHSTSGYTVIGTYAYSNPQNYGHIIMSSFSISDSGNYRATGLLTASATSIATVLFTVQ